MKNIENLQFCYEKGFNLSNVKNLMTSKAVAYKSKYWNRNQIIKVYFMGGTSSQIAEMKSVIGDLLAPLSLLAEFVTSPVVSDIRIDFKAGYGSWSYLGTDCMLIPKTEQTLNIGWSGRDVMYHEFGHALNLAHEHQNPKGGIVWNEAQVISDLKGAPNYWSEEDIRYNVLNKLDTTQVDSTNFDSGSIMLYYFPNSWTVGDFQTNDNLYPSKIDRDFLLSTYGELQDTTLPVITLITKEQVKIPYGSEYNELGATAVDNIDGDITSKIQIEGTIDTKQPGLQYVIYTVSDKAGNVAEKIRTVLVMEEEKSITTIRAFIKELFPTTYRLSQLTEDQLMVIAEAIDIPASIDDLKKDTINNILKKL